MTILTKPGISKGVPAQFSLNKANLLLHPTVQADPYFSEPLNWYRVVIVYKSTQGAQYELVEFDATQETPTGTFLVSEKARDIFEVLKIKIIDFDNGFLEITRPSLDPEDWDINFTPSVFQEIGTTFFGTVVKSNTRNLAFVQDKSNPDEYIVAGQNLNAAATASGYDLIFDMTTGKYDSEISIKLMDSQIHDIELNNDGTVAWLLGEFDTLCCGKTVPAKPTDPIFGQNPLRIFKYDLEADTIQFIANVPQYSGPGATGTNYNTSGTRILIDEPSDRAIVIRGSANNSASTVYILGLSISTGSLIFVKSYNPPSVQAFYYNTTWRQGAVAAKGDGGFFMNVSSFSGRSGIVKISYTDGNLISSYPATPTGSRNNSYWASSPDGRKQSIIQNPNGDTGTKSIYVYTDGVISSEIPLANSSGFIMGFTMSNENIFVLMSQSNVNSVLKYTLSGDYVGVAVNSSSLSVLEFYDPSSGFRNVVPAPCMIFHNEKLYIYSRYGRRMNRFDALSGARDVNFYGAITSNVSTQFGIMTIYGDRLIMARPVPANDVSYVQAALLQSDPSASNITSGAPAYYIFDYNSREIVTKFTLPDITNGGAGVELIGMSPVTSALLPGRVIYGLPASATFNIRVMDRRVTPWSRETGWPTCSVGNFSSLGTDGDFLYVAGTGLTSWSDGSGGFSSAGQVIRINLTTKLIDRTFNPTLPSYSAGKEFSFTNDYIYLSASGLLWRIKKSDLSVQRITNTDIGVSSTFTNVLFVSKVNSGNIIINMYNGKFDNKPYVQLDEASLTQTGLQPATLTETPFFLAYNFNNDTLAGLYQGSGNFFISYVISTASKTVNSPAMGAFPNSGYADQTSSDSAPRVIPRDNKFLFGYSRPLIYDYKVYEGIIQMNPMGTIKNS